MCIYYLPQMMKGLMTKADNEIFAHYIFMDNEFFLPTATGVPLKFALHGTFTPGIKGGLNIARDMVIFLFLFCKFGLRLSMMIWNLCQIYNSSFPHFFPHRARLPSCPLLALSL